MTLVLQLVVWLLIVAAPAEAVVFFDDSFENAVVPLRPPAAGQPFPAAPSGWYINRSWNPQLGDVPPGGTPSTPFIDPAGKLPGQVSDQCYFTTERAHSGTISWKASYSTCCLGDLEDQCKLSATFPASSEFYVRYWRYAENYSMFQPVNQNKNVYFFTNVGSPNFVANDYGGLTTGFSWQNTRDCGSPTHPFPAGPYNPNCNTSWAAAPNLGNFPGANNAWQCMEFHVRMNTFAGATIDRNALAEAWINGIPTVLADDWAAQPYNAETTPATFGGLMTIYRQGAAPGSVLYYDDFAVGTERIGCGSIAQTSAPRVGVIRFDAWPSNGPSVADIRVRNLDPNQWHSRIPFFGSETGFNSVTMNENLQSVIDQELAYSVAAGIKFWCFNHLTTELHGAIDAYRASTSPNKSAVKICTQEGGLGTARIADTIALMNAERANWLTVPDGRPVIFLQTFFGLIDAAGVTDLRNAVIAASFPTPYLICQHDTAAAVVNDANAVGCDAISSYPAAGHQVSAGNPFSDLATKTQIMWDQWGATGRKVIPFVTAGWDVRPDDAAGSWWQGATPQEIAAHLQAALSWSAAHPTATTEHNLIHMFAWNEIGEGGWLLPSNVATNPVGTGRLDAIQQVLLGVAPLPAAPSNLRCNICN